jgi:hypothetical protein
VESEPARTAHEPRGSPDRQRVQAERDDAAGEPEQHRHAREVRVEAAVARGAAFEPTAAEQVNAERGSDYDQSLEREPPRRGASENDVLATERSERTPGNPDDRRDEQQHRPGDKRDHEPGGKGAAARLDHEHRNRPSHQARRDRDQQALDGLGGKHLQRRGPARAGHPRLGPAPLIPERSEQADVCERAGEEPDRRNREQRLRLRARGPVPLELGTEPGLDAPFERAGAGIAGLESTDVVAQPLETAGIEAIRVEEVAKLVGERDRRRRRKQARVRVRGNERLREHLRRVPGLRQLDVGRTQRLVAEPERRLRALDREQAHHLDRKRPRLPNRHRLDGGVDRLLGREDAPVADVQAKLSRRRGREGDLEERHRSRPRDVGRWASWDDGGDGLAHPCAHAHARRNRHPAGDEADVRAHAAVRDDRQVAKEPGRGYRSGGPRSLRARFDVRLEDIASGTDNEGRFGDKLPERRRQRLSRTGGTLGNGRQRVGGAARREAVPFEHADVTRRRGRVRDHVAQTVVGDGVEQARQRREEEAGDAEQRQHRQWRARLEPQSAQEQPGAASQCPSLGDVHGATVPSPLRSTGAGRSARMRRTWTAATATSTPSSASSNRSTSSQGTETTTGGTGAAPEVPSAT